MFRTLLAIGPYLLLAVLLGTYVTKTANLIEDHHERLRLEAPPSYYLNN